ncbi:MAG: 2-oxo acid dehydrogenase subunit E2 [Clostridia bacterium]|nr:2-oxo acid dehydrogenase subunit E2 [Clostridia bacterium]
MQKPDMKKIKKRWGDRKDGRLLRDTDSMHLIIPMLFPDRCNNEAFISETIDLTNLNAWLAAHNPTEDGFPYKLFHVIVSAVLKTVIHRPLMNRFIANKNLYERNWVSASFTVKKEFADDGGEALAILYADGEDTIGTVREKIRDQVRSCRGDTVDASTGVMDALQKLPRFLVKAIVAFMRMLDRHGKVPQSMIDSDPYYASVLLSNLGSIKLKAGYHHLANWGTTSCFCVIGEKKMRPVFDENGNAEMRDTVTLGLTVDERIADGYYFSKSVRLLKKLLENPELLELPFSTEVDY